MAFIMFLVFCLLVTTRPSLQFPEEENNEESLHQGDIKLSRKQRIALKVFRNPSAALLGARGITNEQHRLWDNGVVYYNISHELEKNPTAAAVILSAMKEWEESSCLKFARRKSEKNYIEFFKGSGCWSYVGKQGGMQQISLAKGCWFQGTVAHEIGHAVGYWHEQSRPDRDDHVTIQWENIPIDKRHNFQKYNASQVNSMKVAYDYLSVMHYSETAFGINGSTTIVAKDSSVVQLGQRVGLSPKDVQQADLLYRCNGKTTRKPVRPSPQPPPKGTDACTFENGTCGFTNAFDDDFDWTQRIGGTPSRGTGPETDHTTLRFGHFMYIETSSPRKLGDVAILQSKLYPASCKGRCLHFYYHMYGDQMGSLKVILSPQRGRGTGLWEKSQDMGNEWLLANVRIPPVLSQYMIKFVGIRGDGYRGDAAIDDVFFTEGKCP